MIHENTEKIEIINNNEVPDGYKLTDMGLIPSEWKIKRVKELVDENIIFKPMDGNHGALHPTSNDYVPIGIPFVLATDIENDRLDLINCKYISKGQADKLQKGFAYEGDVLLTHKGSVGNTVVVPKILTEYIMLTPQVTYYRVKNLEMLNNYYLKNYFQSPLFKKNLEILSKGATRNYIGIVEQQKLAIILPSNIKEQEKISEIFNIWNKAVALTEKLIAQKKEFKKGITHKLLTGKIRIAGFNSEWQRFELGQVIKNKTEKTTINNQYPVLSCTKDGIVLQSEHFNKQIASENNIGYKILCRNELALSPMNLHLGGIDISNYETGIVSPAYKVYQVDYKRINKDFLRALLRSEFMIKKYESISQKGASVVRRNLSISDFESITITAPKDVLEINAIGKFLSLLDTELSLLEQELFLLTKQKDGLMQLLFTGKVRVKY